MHTKSVYTNIQTHTDKTPEAEKMNYKQTQRYGNIRHLAIQESSIAGGKTTTRAKATTAAAAATAKKKKYPTTMSEKLRARMRERLNETNSERQGEQTTRKTATIKTIIMKNNDYDDDVARIYRG